MNKSNKYRVVGDSKNTFLGIELSVVVDSPKIGDSFNLLGSTFTVVQTGKILVLADKDWCLSIMDITPPKEKELSKLIINDTLEIFLDTKEVAVKVKCTYEELYYALQREWKLLAQMGHGTIPFEYSNRLRLFTFLDGWGFENDNFSMLTEGSFTRVSPDGRSI